MTHEEIPALYGSLVFNDKVMRNKLPKDMYKALRKTIENGTHLELDVANSVAVAMKEWAVENGATHYTHWFQPMTGVTAEKHDSFISPERRWKSHYGVFRQRTCKGRTGCIYLSHPAGFVLLLKQEVIQHGIRHLHAFIKDDDTLYTDCISALTAEKH